MPSPEEFSPKGDAPRWDGPQVRNFDVVEPESIVTHFGNCNASGRFSFQEEPKWREYQRDPWVEVDISMLRGAFSIDEASRQVRRMTVPLKKRKREAVRYFVARQVWEHSYFVFRTPSRGNPDHVSVYGNLEEIEEMCPPGTDRDRVLVASGVHRAWWARPERVKLNELDYERRGRDAVWRR